MGMNVHDILSKKGTQFGNLTVFPILVRDYEVFQENKLCLTIMQKKLGIEYLQMPYLHMLLVLSAQGLNMLEMLSRILSLCLHINEEQIIFDLTSNSGKVSLVIVKDSEFPEIIETISEMRFNKLRSLIAEQNNIELPDELANIEILESEEYLQSLSSANLDVNFKSLYFSVATYCGFTTEQMDDMTIYEFDERISAISRITRHLMYGQGEMSGMVSFKGGNPYPSWCFDRKKDGLHGAIPLEQFEEKMSVVANPV